jgi:hypothetical protein
VSSLQADSSCPVFTSHTSCITALNPTTNVYS